MEVHNMRIPDTRLYALAAFALVGTGCFGPFAFGGQEGDPFETDDDVRDEAEDLDDDDAAFNDADGDGLEDSVDPDADGNGVPDDCEDDDTGDVDSGECDTGGGFP